MKHLLKHRETSVSTFKVVLAASAVWALGLTLAFAVSIFVKSMPAFF
jgi:hypothetical protein